MVDIVTRAGKGSPLTNAEVDANFTNLAEVATVGGEPIGHEDITESSISFTTASRTFSISPVGASFTVWCKGNKHVFTSAQTVVIPNTTGLHYIYFSDAGVLSTKTTYFTWDSDAPTAYVYWNATTGAAVYFGDERHGVVLDWQTHEYLHRTRGAAIANGFAASGYTTTGTGNLNADAQLAVEGGTFFDEDMQVDIVSTATPTANTWQQNLAFPAKIPVLHLQGTAWVLDAPTNFPLKQGTARPQYNLLSGGVWSTADVTNNKYGTTWILATNNLTYPVVAIIGQSQADSQGDAEATSFSSLNLPDFPSVEFRPLYKLVYNCADSNTNTPHARIVNVIDLRSLSAANPAANPATDHGNLSGLVDDDHPQYVHISATRTVSTAVKNSLLPTQTSNSGKYLQTDGSTASWQNVVSASDGALTLNTSGTGISGSATFSANQATASTFTVTSNATSANTASTIVARDASGNFSAGTISAALSGNATTASNLQTGRTIAMTGDVTYTSPSFNGSQNVTAAATLANSGVTAGTYGSSTAIPSLAVDAKGRVTAASTSAISVGDGAFTVNTSTGLSGGGQLGTANQASATSITLTNTDRGSSQAIFKNIAVSGQNTIVADSNNDTLTIVGGSNVTVTTDSATDTLTIAASQPSVGNGNLTVNTGSGLTGGAQLGTANQSTNTSITLSHADTSTQASVNNSNGVVIQDVTLDGFGHVTGLASVDLDGRYAVTGHTHSQYIPINPDGDGNAWAYSDNNPTVNGVYIGGVQSFGADGVINGGGLQSKLINAWNGFVNSSNGYYVGTRDFSADSLTYSTTKVIDSSANVFPGGGTGYLTNNPWNSVRVQSPSGYIDFGPANTSWAHIYTDRPAFYFNTDLYVLGSRVFHDGYHPNADKWTTPRTNTVTLTGDVTGSGNASVDGSGNWTVSIPAVVGDNSHNHSIDSISDEHRLFNNMGDNHSTRTSFDAQGGASTVNFGWRYVQGATNGPGVNSATQYYSQLVGLGNDYAYNTYGMQIAYPRNVSSPYITIRYEEGGVLGAWQKISAGYADSAGSASTADYATTAGSADQIDGWGFVNTGSNSAVNADTINSNGISYYTAGVTNFSGNSTDGALYSQRYSDSWQHQIAGDYRSGQIALRGRNNGTWQAWRTVVDSSNVGTYAALPGHSHSNYVTTTYNSSLNSDSRNSRGVTRLYRRDDNSDYSVQTYWTGSYWRLYGYNGDSSHADVQVGYADNAGYASSAGSATDNTKLSLAGGNMSGNIGRTSHSSGYLVGSYNSVSGNSDRTNPIYTIGSSYQPSDGDLVNMYGIGYSHSNAAYDGINTVLSGWGLYVAGGGTARVGLDGDYGVVKATGAMQAPVFYDYNDTSYYADPNSGSRLLHIFAGNVASSNDGGWNARMNLVGSSHARLDVVSNSDGIITTMYSHTGQGVGRVGTYSNHPLVLMAQGGAEGGQVYSGSLRSAIFYDSSNTTYYVDPASTSTSANFAGTAVAATFNATSTTNGGFQGIDADSAASPSFTWTADLNTGMYRYGADVIGFTAGGNDEFRVYTSYTLSPGSSRAPIFYDSNNTSYYTNPASTSVLNALNVNTINGVSASELGGASAGGVIYENNQTITASYTLTTNKNGMSAGPITINSGVTVTVPSGSAWTVV